jgi:hypothetical protein
MSPPATALRRWSTSASRDQSRARNAAGMVASIPQVVTNSPPDESVAAPIKVLKFQVTKMVSPAHR